MTQEDRQPFDLEGLVARSRHGPCFICELIKGNPDYAHPVIAEDEDHILFLSKYPTQRAYALVCPKRHVEDLALDLSTEAYLALQARVHRLSRAMTRVLPVERVYVLSLGSKQGNSHLHFHVVPLPPDVPYERQQYHALMAEHGVLDIPAEQMAELAGRLGSAYAQEG
jgi:diadenosine tetraphosphate (Ap4A) HIT family hydrolase